MESIKLTKKLLNLTPGELLIKINAVSPESENAHKQAYPWHVYCSPKSYKALKKYSENLAKKQKFSSQSRRLSVEMEFLNYGPNECEGIRDGYLLVDRVAIAKEIEEFSNERS